MVFYLRVSGEMMCFVFFFLFSARLIEYGLGSFSFLLIVMGMWGTGRGGD